MRNHSDATTSERSSLTNYTNDAKSRVYNFSSPSLNKCSNELFGVQPQNQRITSSSSHQRMRSSSSQRLVAISENLFARVAKWVLFYLLLFPMIALSLNTLLSPAKGILLEPSSLTTSSTILFTNEWVDVGYQCANKTSSTPVCWLSGISTKQRIRAIEDNHSNKLIHMFYCDIDESELVAEFAKNASEVILCRTTWMVARQKIFTLEFLSEYTQKEQASPIQVFVRATAHNYVIITLVSMLFKAISSYLAIKLVVTTYPLVWRSTKATHLFKDFDLSAFIMGHPTLVFFNFLDWLANVSTMVTTVIRMSTTQNYFSWFVASLYLTKMLWLISFLMKVFGRDSSATIDTTFVVLLAYATQISVNYFFYHFALASRIMGTLLHLITYEHNVLEFLVGFFVWALGISAVVYAYVRINRRLKTKVHVSDASNCLVDILAATEKYYIRGISISWYGVIPIPPEPEEGNLPCKAYLGTTDQYALPVWLLSYFSLNEIGVLSFEPHANTERFLASLKVRGILFAKTVYITFTVHYDILLCDMKQIDLEDLSTLQSNCIPSVRRKRLLLSLINAGFLIGRVKETNPIDRTSRVIPDNDNLKIVQAIPEYKEPPKWAKSSQAK